MLLIASTSVWTAIFDVQVIVSDLGGPEAKQQVGASAQMYRVNISVAVGFHRNNRPTVGLLGLSFTIRCKNGVPRRHMPSRR